MRSNIRPKMSSPIENEGITRKSSTISALLTLNCNLPINIPVINEPQAACAPGDNKKKSLRFDPSTLTAEYDSEEVKETKRITDEIKKWVEYINIYFSFSRSRGWVSGMEGILGLKLNERITGSEVQRYFCGKTVRENHFSDEKHLFKSF